MYRQTLADLKYISYTYAPDPVRAEKAMHNLLTYSVKVCKSVLTKDLICTLTRCGIGTYDVEECIKRLLGNNTNKYRERKLRKFLMNDKLDDTKHTSNAVRKEFNRIYQEYYKIIQKGSRIDTQFKTLMKNYNETIWKMGKNKNLNKIRHLKNKYHMSVNTEEAQIRGIKYSNKDLEENDQYESCKNEPRMYGGAKVSEKAKTILSIDSNFMIYSKIDMTEMEAEIEKGLAKARYEFMNSEKGKTNKDINEQTNIRIVRESTNTVDYANMKATDIPTVQRLYPPKPGTIRQEKILENIKMKMLNTVMDYKDKYCDDKGNIKNSNLSNEENDGLKEIKECIKKKEIIVSTTDKSGRFVVDKPKNYENAIEEHTKNDIMIDDNKVKQVEHKLNLHMRQFNKIFQVGTTLGQDNKNRVTGATISTNTPPPPLYGLRKDHKLPTDEIKGPPVRPVCGANEAPNSRLSHFLSQIINDYADFQNIKTECKSSEHMKAAFEEFNKLDNTKKQQCCIISMDVKALYPSMEWDEVRKSVRDIVENSELKIESIDWKELGKYLAIILSEEQIKQEHLRAVIPIRSKPTNRNITIAYLHDKKNEDKWLNADKPDNEQKKKMLAIAIAEGVQLCMENHVYCVGDQTFLQTKGGPIGLELTGAISRVFMHRWDQLY